MVVGYLALRCQYLAQSLSCGIQYMIYNIGYPLVCLLCVCGGGVLQGRRLGGLRAVLAVPSVVPFWYNIYHDCSAKEELGHSPPRKRVERR